MRPIVLRAFGILATLAIFGCHSHNGRVIGQTDFISAPPAGANGAGGDTQSSPAPGGSAPTPPKDSSSSGGSAPTRAVEETDLYRLEGNRLYFLNAYRGLMVFDVSDVDHPRLLGRSAIFGSPVEMVVHDGIVVVVVADWYGKMDDGSPFHGSIVRGLDATDPAHIKVLGEAKLGGWVRDTRVVGQVLYAVSEDYGWSYGWGDGLGTSSSGTQSAPSVIVSSVSFADQAIKQVGHEVFPGYSGIFNVTPTSILMAHDPGIGTGTTELLYLDISDPAGKIVKRGHLTVEGAAQGWGADQGRWNLDFADGKTAHVIGCRGANYCDGQAGYMLDTVDFSNPDTPKLASALPIPTTGWGATARFDGNRLYLSPNNDWSPQSGQTPLEVYDLTDPAAPKRAGTVQIPGTVWIFMPAPQQRLFALGNDWQSDPNGSQISLKYLDVSDPAKPTLLGTSTFGQGWAWTPAAGTFKAFTMDADKGLVVLPFSGWSSVAGNYTNGLQLIEFTGTTTRTAGAGKTRGWVERGIFVKNRLVSLSDQALAVIDYDNHDQPKVVSELTLARNVVAALPVGANLAEVSSDWWGNDQSQSEVRILPIDNADEAVEAPNAPTLTIPGVNAQVFRHGDLAYIVTDNRVPVDCNAGQGQPPDSTTGGCWGTAQRVQVVDLSGGGAKLRGALQLPLGGGWFGLSGCGFSWYDWYWGPDALQVGGDALVFRRFDPVYGPDGRFQSQKSSLLLVDLSQPDAPTLASTTITTGQDGWWGNMRVVGNTLYTARYEWVQKGSGPGENQVRYFADRIDLSDRQHPRVQAKINVPGMIVGGSEADPSLLYTIDYRWGGEDIRDEFDVVRVRGDVAELLSTTPFDGWVGATFVRGDKAYLSAQQYHALDGHDAPQVVLHALDLRDPRRPVDRVTRSARGWGWLLGVEGDRMVVTSGWGPQGIDIYRLEEGQAPRFSQFNRTRGWWTSDVARQGNALFLTSGYWGVQRVDLQ